MSIATDAKVRELEKRIMELEKLSDRVRALERSKHEHADAAKLGPKLGVKSREMTDI